MYSHTLTYIMRMYNTLFDIYCQKVRGEPGGYITHFTPGASADNATVPKPAARTAVA